MDKTTYYCAASCPEEEVARIFWEEMNPPQPQINREEVTDVISFLTAAFTMNPVGKDK